MKRRRIWWKRDACDCMIIRMQRFALPILIAFLLLPASAQARIIGDMPKTTVTVEKQSRRVIRETARRQIWRNPAILTFGEARLDSLYENDEFRLRIRYPSSWERTDLNEREETLTLPVMFLGPEEPGKALKQNINLVIETLPSPMTLSQYTELGLRNERAFFQEFALLSSETVPVGGSHRGQRVVFTASADPSAPMKFAQVWFVLGNLAYVWTFADDARTFDRNIATFERMLDSFIVR